MSINSILTTVIVLPLISSFAATPLYNTEMEMACNTLVIEQQIQEATIEEITPKETYKLIEEYQIEYTIHDIEYELTDHELNILACLLQLEVLGKTSSIHDFKDPGAKFEELLAVAETVRNRMEMTVFPDSIHEVIFDNFTKKSGQKVYQFSPAPVLDNCTPTEETYIAAKYIFCGGITILTEYYGYFCSDQITKSYEYGNNYCLEKNENGKYISKHIGDTVFYKSRQK